MAKREKTLSVSAWLLRLGDALRFSPDEEYAAPERERRDYRLIPREKLLTFKNTVARMREQSFFVSLGEDFIRELMLTRFRSFSTLFFACGLIQTVSYFVGSYLPVLSGGQDNLVLGLILIALGLVSAFERLGFGALIKRSFLFRRALQPLLGIADWEIPEGTNREHVWWMLLAGTVLGVLSVAFSPYRVILWLVLAAAALLTLYKPESGLVFTVLLFPFLSSEVTAGLLILLHLSAWMKIAVGKRTLAPSPADIPVLVLMAVLLIRGGSTGALYALILSVYFLGTHLCRTSFWLRRVSAALALSVFIASLAALVARVLAMFAPDAVRLFPGGMAILSTLTGREYVALAVLLLPELFCLANAGRRVYVRLFGVVTVLLALVTLAFSRDPGLWLGAGIGLVLVVALSRRWGFLLCLLTGLGSYTAWKLLPELVRLRITEFFGLEKSALTAISQRLGAGRANLLEALPWGLGSRAAQTVSEGGTVYELAGIFGGWIVLLASAVVFVWFFVRCMRFSTCPSLGGVHPLVLGAMAGVLVWLVCGLTSPVTGPEPLFIVFLFLSFPKAAESACDREEIRQSY